VIHQQARAQKNCRTAPGWPPHPRVMKNRPKRTAAANPWRYGCHPRAVDGAHHCTIHGVTYTDAAGIITGRYSCHPPPGNRGCKPHALLGAHHRACRHSCPQGIKLPPPGDTAATPGWLKARMIALSTVRCTRTRMCTSGNRAVPAETVVKALTMVRQIEVQKTSDTIM
jgi:hypothetical protein